MTLTCFQLIFHSCGLVNKLVSLFGPHGHYVLQSRVVMLERQHLSLHTREQIGDVGFGQSGEHLWGDSGVFEKTRQSEDILCVVWRQSGQGHPVEVF